MTGVNDFVFTIYLLVTELMRGGSDRAIGVWARFPMGGERISTPCGQSPSYTPETRGQRWRTSSEGLQRELGPEGPDGSGR